MGYGFRVAAGMMLGGGLSLTLSGCGGWDEIGAASEQVPPLFDCQGAEYRYILHAMPDGEFSIQIDSPPQGKIGVSTHIGHVDGEWIGMVVGQEGGHQSHLRLTTGSGHFIFFEGEDGQLADQPGRRYAGVSNIDNTGAELMSIDCEATDLNRALLENVRKHREAAGIAMPAAEVPDSPFNGWF